MPLKVSDFVLITFTLIVIKVYFNRRRNPSGYPYPPGPRSLPIVGNLFDVPQTASWVTYGKWAKKYGDLLSVNMLGKTVVVINSAEVAKELLDKRGSVYSDRPSIPMHDLMSFNSFSLVTMRYGNQWRTGRKVADQCLRLNAAVTYRPMQKRKAHEFLRNIMRDPDNFLGHIKYLTASVIMSLTYGQEITSFNDRYVALLEESVKRAVATILPNSVLVNVFPALQYLPRWLPGMGFLDFAADTCKLLREAMDAPFSFVKKEMENGTALPSLTREGLNLYETSGIDDEAERTVKGVAATIYMAGVETTVSAVSTVFAALILHPEVQRRAQAELDAVVGRDRLPGFEDRKELPYVEAVCMELLRWKVITPLAIPHATSEDDVYGNYFIPKGSHVLANVWAILHDPVAYPDPESFIPERFMTPEGSVKEDPLLTCAFGFGRRICPGRHLADATLWIVVASILSAFHVGNAKDESGHNITPTFEFTESGASCHPLPFTCSIVPRDRQAQDLIKASEVQADQ
ncbi:hypothetical protein EW146_g1905 [Bondarzewia mesenterica]|uniref:Cytochrome P450 n=1 Tax=Bondarzewia mesenterica TaxID=1095465 RepID=A0A4S4M4K9_9AGAM|nr:hypothetical protein EW146_g1905 [Bondarzewia mesenterica]